MKRVLVFGGTTEGRRLAQELARHGAQVSLHVAGEYGKAVLPPEWDSVEVQAGRLDAAEMAALMQSGGFAAVVDATHPYAREVSANIRAAAEESGLRLLRLLREESAAEDCRVFSSVAQAAAWLAGTQGNILAATGSRELAAYAAIPGFAERVYPRVLPAAESLRACEALGVRPGNVIAMQGPFSEELNCALMRQFSIRWLVTKDGGPEGAFDEKLRAAKRAGAEVLLVRRPAEASGGLHYEQLLAALLPLLEN